MFSRKLSVTCAQERKLFVMTGVKLTFIFTNYPSLEEAPREEQITTTIELPAAVRELAGLRDHILEIAENVAYFTQYSLFVHCPDANLKYHPVVQQVATILGFFNALCLYFDVSINQGRQWKKTRFNIYAPIIPPFRTTKTQRYSLEALLRLSSEHDYGNHLKTLIESLLTLLNTTPTTNWKFSEFHPWQWQNRQVTRRKKFNAKRNRAAASAERQQKRLAEKIASQSEKAAGQSTGPTTHGAGRMPGARPGIYNGIQMRSQLEIRFAAELDERGIKWVYEGEALSASSYLVDFFLPDLDVWVEVKGRFDARDKRVLPEIATFLKSQRRQRLLVYTGSGNCWVVNPSGFRKVDRKSFWSELVK